MKFNIDDVPNEHPLAKAVKRGITQITLQTVSIDSSQLIAWAERLEEAMSIRVGAMDSENRLLEVSRTIHEAMTYVAQSLRAKAIGADGASC